MDKLISSKDISDKLKDEIKTYAKTLYMQADSHGTHIYSTREIEDKIAEGFGVKYSHVSIYLWAKDGGWDKEYDKEIKKGEQKAIDTIKQDIQEQNFTNIQAEMTEQEYRNKLQEVKKYVVLGQYNATKKANEYFHNLPKDSKQIPGALTAISNAHNTLYKMLSDSPMESNQKMSMNISIVQPENIQVNNN